MTDCIVIPTRERANLLANKKHHTMMYAQHWKGTKFLAVMTNEVENYTPFAKEYGFNIIRLQPNVDTLAKTYDEIFKRAKYYDKILMLDDDLTFYRRKDYATSKIVQLPIVNFPDLVEDLFLCLKYNDVALAGLTPRSGAFNHTSYHNFNQRLSTVLACKTKIVNNYMWEWGHDSLFEHHMNLTLLKEGYRNVMVTKYAYDTLFDSYGDDVGGGNYRDVHTRMRSAIGLANDFPNVVKTREKKIKGVPTIGLDIVMYMKKAFGGER